ncbi:hypothetical protein SASPL_128403 [Salvia splendens]|uniref:VQ domain-containing protein n=1 Tax=Salvia splendens TaxID=180675 RepID=A0A8X8XDQ7_SALSN|nr:VQ motif-containing protein 20-like [Salvia splendens]KAG6410345.1 hypothetical protein SASPL_128403 [Salvia splendens]
MRVNKDSHIIQKPPSNHHPSAGAKPRQPLIIYTHSPKVIHAAPSNFMKLVQRLTGQSDDGDGEATPEAAAKVEVGMVKEEDDKVDTSSGGFGNTVGGGIGSYEENYETASSIDDQRFEADVNQDLAALYRMPYLVEGEPQLNGSSDFYCSPRTSSMFQSAMAESSISPYMDYMKPYTDY